MNNRNVFWGIVVLLMGILLLLNTMGVLPFSVWQIFWPIMLILAGLWFLFGGKFVQPSQESVAFFQPMENTRRAEIKIHHGAGELNISALSTDNHEHLLDGSFGGGMEPSVTKNGDLTTLKLRAPMDVFPFVSFPHRQGYDWDMSLSRHVPLVLKLHTGANKSMLNLHDLNITELKLETGASDTEVVLPAVTEYTKFKLQSGAASVNVRVPSDVAAKIRVTGALMGGDIDLQRFPLVSSQPGDKLYQSADYEASAKQVEIRIESGVGSINIH